MRWTAETIKAKLPGLRIAATFAVLLGVPLALAVSQQSLASTDAQQLLTIDHVVPHVSTVPAIAGQPVQLYLRERVQAGMTEQNMSFVGKVVLFIHGTTLASEAAFDVPYGDYSWMAYLAQAGFDVFAVDLTGYGRSTRPAPMADPCNMSPQEQVLLIPAVLPEACPPSYPFQLTTLASDWDDIDAAVDYVRALRQVDRVHLVGWSRGGPRAGGYVVRHPEKVERLVLFAPLQQPMPTSPPAAVPAPGLPMVIQGREGLEANWDRQVGCPDQFDPAIRNVVWAKILETDAVGAGWGPGVWRAPVSTAWGWNAEVAALVQAPTLVISGELDANNPFTVPERVRELYADLGTVQKVFLDIACTSHFAQWETHHIILFDASLEWLRDGALNGIRQGFIRRGD